MTMTDGPGADNGDAKGGVPSVPPPTYAEVAASRARPARTQSTQTPSPPPARSQPAPAQTQQPPVTTNGFSQLTPSSPPPRHYGPTPIPTSQPDTTTILPYYDPRSPWALQAATSRARWRFFGALFWACIIWLAVGSLVGGAVDERTRRGGSWAAE